MSHGIYGETWQIVHENTEYFQIEICARACVRVYVVRVDALPHTQVCTHSLKRIPERREGPGYRQHGGRFMLHLSPVLAVCVRACVRVCRGDHAMYSKHATSCVLIYLPCLLLPANVSVYDVEYI